MATRVVAPSMGEGVEELTVVKWLKSEGDTVAEFDVIVELETDKVSTEIPTPVAGTLLKIVAQPDEVVKVGSTLAWVGQPGEALETGQPAETEKTAQPAVGETAPESDDATQTVAAISSVPEPADQEYTGLLTPLVRKLAAANQVDLNQVKGTGKEGRITKEDIQNYLEMRNITPAQNAAPVARPTAAPASTPTPAEALHGLPGSLVAHTSLRRQIAERMVKSHLTVPPVLTVMEADLSMVLAHRAANKEAFATQGVNLTLTAYFCAAIVDALRDSPEVNSTWTEEGLELHSVINLGMAVALGGAGLIVPVIKDAGALSLQGLAQKINDLSTRARTKKLLPEEVKDGTFTLTNHGSGGSLFASPIIVPPQAAILGTGMMIKRPIVVNDDGINDSITIRPMIYLSLVFDHRILDGEGADRFLKKIKERLENWG